MFRRPDQIPHPLYVVSVVFNPIRYRSRWRLFADFARHVQQSGDAVLYTVEVAFGDRAFVLGEAEGIVPERHLQLRTSAEVWLKENALNLLVARLPPSWKYVAWIDADVAFARPDWANETLHQLQHYGMVQLWSEALDLTPTHGVLAHASGFAWCHWNEHRAGVPPRSSAPADYYYGQPARTRPGEPPRIYWHPGYAWGMRRDAWEAAGGLIDWQPLGSADRFMAEAAIGKLEPLPAFVGETDRRWLLAWQARLGEHLRGNMGFVEGTLLHYWHGAKAARQYGTRGQILIDCAYCPESDLVRDAQGLWRLRGSKPALRDQLQRYFRARNEDAI